MGDEHNINDDEVQEEYEDGDIVYEEGEEGDIMYEDGEEYIDMDERLEIDGGEYEEDNYEEHYDENGQQEGEE